MRQAKGMILISVLIFLSLVSLLLMISMESSGLEHRMSQNELRLAQNEQTAKVGLRKALADLNAGFRSCEIAPLPENELMAKSAQWWQSGMICQGSFAGERYQYLFESLQTDPCAMMLGKEGVQYWRIIVRAEQSHDYGAVVILQETVAVPTETMACLGERRTLYQTIQSFRVLNREG